MLRQITVGKLRQTRLWGPLKRIQTTIGPKACSTVHMIVSFVPSSWVPTQLGLKHTYDYLVINIDPLKVDRLLRVGEWARLDPQVRHPRISRFKSWLRLGGGWKHLQRHVSRNWHGRFIAAGDWDLRDKPFTILPSIVDLFVEGAKPQDTEEYQKLRDWVRAGEFGWTRGCCTVEDIDRYFEELEDLYDSIRTEGYKTQAELGERVADEIRICIDRHGHPLVFDGGTHRLSIAKLLKLPSVPVVVKRVHADWVEQCRSIYDTNDVRKAIACGLASMEANRDGAER